MQDKHIEMVTTQINQRAQISVQRLGAVEAVEVWGRDKERYKLGGYRLIVTIEGADEVERFVPHSIEFAELLNKPGENLLAFVQGLPS